ncbi:hypothetical protein LSAT2_015028 [Lamellibrachia satsuma]|nr:hypothetical protein LSAT2_015028 [Lamellibrachia satsuma]
MFCDVISPSESARRVRLSPASIGRRAIEIAPRLAGDSGVFVAPASPGVVRLVDRLERRRCGAQRPRQIDRIDKRRYYRERYRTDKPALDGRGKSMLPGSVAKTTVTHSHGLADGNSGPNVCAFIWQRYVHHPVR